jgi:hypothetical protein
VIVKGGDYDCRSMVDYLNDRTPDDITLRGSLFEPTVERHGRWIGYQSALVHRDEDGRWIPAFVFRWYRRPTRADAIAEFAHQQMLNNLADQPTTAYRSPR